MYYVTKPCSGRRFSQVQDRPKDMGKVPKGHWYGCRFHIKKLQRV